MMNSKHLIAGALAGMLTIPMVAQTESTVVTVNGSQVEKTLTRMTFSGDRVILHFSDGSASRTEDMATVTVSLSAVTGIDRVKTFAGRQLLDNELFLEGIAAGDRVTLYDVSGRMRMQTTAASETVRLSLAGLKTGVYIVKAGNNIIKFQKK